MTDALHVELGEFSLRRSFSMQTFGRYDPTAIFASETVFVKNVVSQGRVLVVRCEQQGSALHVTVEGEGGALLEAWRSWLPPDDGVASFPTGNERVSQLHRRYRDLRLFRVPWLFDLACSAILQQRIAVVDAAKQYARIAKAFGPKVGAGAAFPDAATLSKVPLYELERLGVDAQRARTLRALARAEAERSFLEIDSPAEQVVRRFGAQPGIGPWTLGVLRGYGLGEADAEIVGDLHLPHLVCWALAGEAPGSDARMLELLEPFRGHRFRVVRLLFFAGISVPRLKTPVAPPRSHG